MSAIIARTYLGALLPERLAFELTNENADWLDLTTASNVTVTVKKPSGDIETWACTIYGTPTASSLFAYHGYVVGDINEAGEFIYVPKCTVVADIGSGPVMFSAKTLHVTDPFA